MLSMTPPSVAVALLYQDNHVLLVPSLCLHCFADYKRMI